MAWVSALSALATAAAPAAPAVTPAALVVVLRAPGFLLWVVVVGRVGFAGLAGRVGFTGFLALGVGFLAGDGVGFLVGLFLVGLSLFFAGFEDIEDFLGDFLMLIFSLLYPGSLPES